MLNDDESTRGAARADLRFFGRVTAGVSHEITNIFTIIGEFAGLLNDLVALTEKGRPLAPETVKRAADNIAKQLERGRILVRHMNSFAHGADEPVREILLTDLLLNVAALSARPAALHRTELRLAFPAYEMKVTTDAFGLRRAVQEGILAALEGLNGGVVLLSLERSDDEAAVTVRGGTAAAASLSELSARLGGRYVEGTAPDGARLRTIYLKEG